MPGRLLLLLTYIFALLRSWYSVSVQYGIYAILWFYDNAVLPSGE